MAHLGRSASKGAVVNSSAIDSCAVSQLPKTSTSLVNNNIDTFDMLRNVRPLKIKVRRAIGVERDNSQLESNTCRRRKNLKRTGTLLIATDMDYSKALFARIWHIIVAFIVLSIAYSHHRTQIDSMPFAD
jgi:hypothetical protein